MDLYGTDMVKILLNPQWMTAPIMKKLITDNWLMGLNYFNDGSLMKEVVEYTVLGWGKSTS